MRLLHFLVFAVLTCSSTSGQNRAKAQLAVKSFLEAAGKSYVPSGYGECFDQTHPDEVQAVMGGTGTIMYSLVHTYSLDGVEHIDEYFHLDADYKVLGHLSSQQMTDLTTRILFGSPRFIWILDSLGADTTAIEERR